MCGARISLKCCGILMVEQSDILSKILYHAVMDQIDTAEEIVTTFSSQNFVVNGRGISCLLVGESRGILLLQTNGKFAQYGVTPVIES